MAKDKFGPKAIANRMKAKGLQKLRFYCQVCQKQCRDDNGFKCHMMSESHLRMISLFSENASQHIDDYSKEFQEEFLKLLRRMYGTRRVYANSVYQEYITDKQHLHMNATKWPTLSDFVSHLGRNGLCHVDEDERGFYVTYIDRRPETLAKLDKQAELEKEDVNEEDRRQKDLQRQIERSIAQRKDIQDTPVVPFQRTEDKKISIVIGKKSSVLEKPAVKTISDQKDNDRVSDNSCFVTAINSYSNDANHGVKKEYTTSSDIRETLSSSVGINSLNEIRLAEEARKEKEHRQENWLQPNIVVRVLNKKIGDGKYYKEKGTILKVIDTFVGEIRMLNSQDVLRIDQSQCETVIPSVSKMVRIVNGAYRDSDATVVQLDDRHEYGELRIIRGMYRDRLVRVHYADFSKLVE